MGKPPRLRFGFVGIVRYSGENLTGSPASGCRMNGLAPPPSRPKVRGLRFFRHRKSFWEFDIRRLSTFDPIGCLSHIVQ